MAQKIVNIDGLGQTILVRRKGVKHIRLSFDRNGLLKVTVPYFLPYSVGISFAKSKKNWVDKHQLASPKPEYFDQQKIGRYHRLVRSAIPLKGYKSVVIKGNNIYFYGELSEDTVKLLEKLINRCLKDEAIELLPSRLNKIADKYGYSYEDVKIKKMHSRWGSCSNLRVIALSYYLVQLPWELIDYVLLHELVHTKHMNHSVNFWSQLEADLPNAKQLRKQLKNYQPIILTNLS